MYTAALGFVLGCAFVMLGLCLLGESEAIKRAAHTLLTLVDVVLPTGRHAHKWWRRYTWTALGAGSTA